MVHRKVLNISIEKDQSVHKVNFFSLLYTLHSAPTAFLETILNSFYNRYLIKNMTVFPNTEKRLENMMRSRVLLTNFLIETKTNLGETREIK